MNARELFAMVAGIGLLVSPVKAQSSASEAQAAEALKKAVAEKPKKSPPVAPAKPALRLATPAELERLYLDGNISAKEYQRKLAEYKASQTAPADAQVRALETLRQDAAAREALAKKSAPPAPKSKATPPAPAPAPGKVAPAEDNAAEHQALSNVEKKFDQLIEQKKQREKATQTAPPAPEPKTKREKLDLLLRQLVDGKINEADYEAQRAKIVAGPE